MIPAPCSFHLHPRFVSTPLGFRPAPRHPRFVFTCFVFIRPFQSPRHPPFAFIPVLFSSPFRFHPAALITRFVLIPASFIPASISSPFRFHPAPPFPRIALSRFEPKREPNIRDVFGKNILRVTILGEGGLPQTPAPSLVWRQEKEVANMQNEK